jgi:hypothetical protein
MRSWLPLQLGLKYYPESQPPISPASSNVSPTDDDVLDRQAQVISLLDLVLRTTQSVSESNKESALSELASLDVKLRTFLGVMMFESSKRQNSFFAPVALSIRYEATRGNILDDC